MTGENVKIVSEESVVIDVVKNAEPSVVTIAAKRSGDAPVQLSPFSFFGFDTSELEEGEDDPQNIGSGFIVTKDGLVVTNKHVVNNTSYEYQVHVSNGKKYAVKQIYRDPTNDIAILKVDPNENRGNNLKPVVLGDSNKIQVGQLAIAIGTALGEFNNTVTTGVVSGVGRGILAGDQVEMSVEELSDVIQTDAAINPGNSGGPLLNSSGQVIGVNTAVSRSGQNIGFALPINTIKDSISNFNITGKFDRAYLGVGYKLIDQKLAIANDLPAGAYIQTVVDGSAAQKAGIKPGYVITHIDKKKLVAGKYEISTIVSKKKIGDKLTLTIYSEDANGNATTKDIVVTLSAAPTP
jgi:S1-C subfamily serine protease